MSIEGYRLSPQQRRVWHHHERAGGALRSELLLAVEGSLDSRRFEQALGRVAAEIEILRTSFQHAPGLSVPVQVVEETVQAPLVELNADGDPDRPSPAVMMRRFREACGFGDDLTSTPLVRNVLARFGDSLTYWYVVTPAICADAEGLNQYVAAVAAAYAGAEPAADEPLQYADVAEWLNQVLEGEEAEPARIFWRKHAQAGGVQRLPFELAGAERRPFNPALRSFSVPAETLDALMRRCERENVDAAVVLLTAWRLLLYRLAGSEEGIIGLGSTRTLDELRETIGLLRQYVPVSLPIRADTRVGELLRETAAAVSEAIEWQDWFDPEHAESAQGSSAPVSFPFCFDFNPDPGATSAPGLSLSVRGRYCCLDRFKLRLSCWHSSDRLVVELYYDADLFRADDIELCEARYLTLLESIVASPQETVDAVDVLPRGERRMLIQELNQTDADYPREACIHRLIADAAKRDPEALAVIHGDARISYAQLLDQAEKLARRLVARGAGPGVRIGLCVERSVEMIVGILGILGSGAAYLPLDPKYPRERLAFMIEDSGASLLLTRRELADRLDDAHGSLLFLQDLLSGPEPAAEAGPAAVAADDPAYVIYTSGSTGQPKGVQISHRNLVSSTSARTRYYGAPVRRFLLLSSFAFDSSMVGIFWTLYDGGTLCLPDQGQEQDVNALGRLIREYRITHTLCLPSLYRLLLSELSPRVLATLTDVIVAGEECSPALTAAHHRTMPSTRLHNEYGPTEATVWATAHTMDTPVDEGERVPIGKPIANARVYVLDARGQPVPFGCPGELFIGGEGVAPGYLNRTELTTERFVEDPFAPDLGGRRMYRTGDMVRYRADGKLEFLGRTDGQIKIRGYRVELGEIENALASHPGVTEAVVLPVEQDGHRRLVAYLNVGETDSPPARGELQEFLRQRLPEFMVPAAFVLLERLPKMPNGKVDRGALPAPDWRAAGETKPITAPRNELEESLVEIWSKVLRIKNLGVHDNYFELGGDSILSIRMGAEAYRRGLQITPMQLIRHQTIAELATVVGRQDQSDFDAGPATGPLPFTPIQHWWLEQELADAHHWNMSTLLDLGAGERLDLDVLRQAAAELVKHHDALRIRLQRADAGWSQHIDAPPGKVHVERFDLSGYPDRDQDRELEAAANRLHASLDLTAGPLVALGLIDLGARGSRLVFVVHHLAVDAVSWPILLEDLASAYGPISRGEAVQLRPKTTSYKRWSERLQALALEPELQQESAYWLAGAESASSIAGLPRDRSGGTNSVASARSHTAYLSAEETEALLRSVPEAYRTQINDALLTAVLDAFCQYTDRSDLPITLEGHGREDVGESIDVSRTVGWFTSLFPVILHRPPVENPGERLKAVKEQLRSVPRRGLSYGLLRYLSGDGEIAASLRRQPEPEVGFNYLGQYDPELGGAGLFRLLPQSAGAEQSPKASRRELIEIVAMVAEGRLRVDWVYSNNHHRSTTIELLAERMIESLRGLIEHCAAPEAGGYTPSDFPEADLDQETLDRLLAQIGRHSAQPAARGSVEAIYPLSSMQEAVLLHGLRAGTEDQGFLQLRWMLRGKLQIPAFQAAWDRVVERHAALRTTAHWEGVDKPLQVVHTGIRLAWTIEDWRTVPPEDRDARLEAFLRADRERGLELRQACPMRFALLEFDDEDFCFVWSCHHLFQDGWSGSLAFRELLAFYEAEVHASAVELESPGNYRDYIAWLNRQDIEPSEAFWTSLLAGTRGSPPLNLPAADASSSGFVAQTLVLDEALAGALKAFVRDQRLTLSTVLQGAWAALLAIYSGEDDVIFGNTVSGRPPEVKHSERIVGLMTNILPTRVQFADRRPVNAWLAEVQERSAAQRAHEHTPVSRIQEWSGLSPRVPLFETLLVFENYGWEGSSEIRADDFCGALASSAPVTLSCSPEPRFTLMLLLDRGRYGEESGQKLLADVVRLLTALVECPEGPLMDLRSVVEAPARSEDERVQSQLETAKEAPRGRLSDDDVVEPDTPTEKLVAEVWTRVLEIDGISVYDNFFDLGGTSLLSLQAVERLERAAELRINPGELVYQTLGQLAASLDARHRPSNQEAEAKPTRVFSNPLRRIFRR